MQTAQHSFSAQGAHGPVGRQRQLSTEGVRHPAWGRGEGVGRSFLARTLEKSLYDQMGIGGIAHKIEQLDRLKCHTFGYLQHTLSFLQNINYQPEGCTKLKRQIFPSFPFPSAVISFCMYCFPINSRVFTLEFRACGVASMDYGLGSKLPAEQQSASPFLESQFPYRFNGDESIAYHWVIRCIW